MIMVLTSSTTTQLLSPITGM